MVELRNPSEKDILKLRKAREERKARVEAASRVVTPRSPIQNQRIGEGSTRQHSEVANIASGSDSPTFQEIRNQPKPQKPWGFGDIASKIFGTGGGVKPKEE